MNRRWARLSAIMGLIVAPMHSQAAMALPVTPASLPKATCSPGDLPETGLQGEVPLVDQLSGRSYLGYSCNMQLVGSNDINGEGMDLTAGMTWYGDCAYLMVRQNTAIAVIDAADPAHPRLAEIIDVPVGKSHESMHASAARGILVVPRGDVAATTPETEKLAIFDVHDCTHPALVTVYDSGIMGTGIHAGALSADGRTYYATFASHTPCVTIFDLDDLQHPTVIASFGDAYPCHDLDLSRDGTRAYLGSYGTVAEGAAQVAPLQVHGPDVSVDAVAPNGLVIADTTDIRDRRPDPQIRTVSTLATGRPHTQAVFQTNGRRYVLEDAEAGCSGTSAKIVDITDEAHPAELSDMALEYHASLRCVAEWPTHQGLNFTTHYVGFDSADDSAGAHEPLDVHLAFIASRGSGLRAVDISDPAHPREVGYFTAPVPANRQRPYDLAQTWVRFRPETGDIWFGNTVNGFTIVKMTRCSS